MADQSIGCTDGRLLRDASGEEARDQARDAGRVRKSPAAGFEDLLDELPPGVRTRGPVRGPLDVIVCFARTRSELAGRLPALRRAMDPAAGLWIAWPKRSSGEATDLSEDVVRELADENTLVDNKVCAIDDVWSALRLVIRLRDR